MSDYSNLSNEELKKRIAAGEDFLRSKMTAQEYADFQKKLDAQKVEFHTMPLRKKRKFRLSFSDLELALSDAPGFVVLLCKILYPVLSFASFLLLIGGGLFALYCAFGVYQVCTVSGLHGILETPKTLYIILFLILNFLVEKLRLIMCMIIDGA